MTRTRQDGISGPSRRERAQTRGINIVVDLDVVSSG
jgi:hypothetical protein